ncbi:MAG TPA: hypothetical protein VEG68_08770 [Terriglobales bacterium]|nr:hypothetical protein [Terriglobales bacterium]
MGGLAQLDLATKGGEARLRALLEDVVEYHKDRLALAVWYGKSANDADHKVLELFDTPGKYEMVRPQRFSLLWKTGSQGPPFVEIYAMSVEHFCERHRSDAASLSQFFQNFEVLYFNKVLLNGEVLQAFNLITEPSGLTKGWYISADEYAKANTLRNLLSSHDHLKPQLGFLKTEESSDFENCRGILHVEVNQRWLPLSQAGLRSYTFFNDWQDDRPGYLLFQGGSLYRLLKFEVRTVPEYAARVLERPRDDSYPEVYLRSVHIPEQPAA